MHISTRVVTDLLLSSTAVILAETLKIDFSTDVVGQTPKGFEFGHTKKVGAPGKWVVQAEGTNKYLAQTAADSTGSRFPVAVLTDISTADADVSVRFKPVSGRVDQAAGLVWRFQDEDNYYIVRANALENNVVPYKVENGKRTDLPIKGEGRTYGKKCRCQRGSGARCASWRAALDSKSTSTGQSCTTWRTRHSRRPGKWVCGRKPIRSPISTI